MAEVVPRKVFEVATLTLTLASGLATIQGYEHASMVLVLSAFTTGLMSLFTSGPSFFFKGGK